MAFRHRRLEQEELEMQQVVRRLPDWFKAVLIAAVKPTFIHRVAATQVIPLHSIRSLRSA